MGLWTPVGYFLCFRTYCSPGYGRIGLHGVRNPTAILVLPVLILIRCAERWEWKRKRDMSFLDWLSFNYLMYMAFIHLLLDHTGLLLVLLTCLLFLSDGVSDPGPPHVSYNPIFSNALQTRSLGGVYHLFGRRAPIFGRGVHISHLESHQVISAPISLYRAISPLSPDELDCPP